MEHINIQWLNVHFRIPSPLRIRNLEIAIDPPGPGVPIPLPIFAQLLPAISSFGNGFGIVKDSFDKGLTHLSIREKKKKKKKKKKEEKFFPFDDHPGPASIMLGSRGGGEA